MAESDYDRVVRRMNAVPIAAKPLCALAGVNETYIRDMRRSASKNHETKKLALIEAALDRLEAEKSAREEYERTRREGGSPSNETNATPSLLSEEVDGQAPHTAKEIELIRLWRIAGDEGQPMVFALVETFLRTRGRRVRPE